MLNNIFILRKKIKDEKSDPSTLPPLAFRDRGHTISVMSPVKGTRGDWDNIRRGNSPRVKESPRNGISPRCEKFYFYKSILSTISKIQIN